MLWTTDTYENKYEGLASTESDVESGSIPTNEDFIGALLERIEELENKALGVADHLQEVDALWQKRRQPLQDEIHSLEAEKADLRAKVRLMQEAKDHAMPPAPGPSYLSWVDDTWFSVLCNVIIVLNFVCMVESTKLEHLHLGPLLDVLDHLFLAWYVFELAVKICYHQSGLFVGTCSRVWWAWLDLGIVVSGVFDQWLLPLFLPASSLGAMSGLGALRVFRVLRALRLLKALWLSDLSWTERPRFETFMATVIAVNSITMWLELDYDWPIWPYVEQAFLIIYSFELVVRLRHLGCRFFTDKKTVVWNVLDLVMVVGGVLDLWLMPAIALVRGIISGKSQGQRSSGLSQVLRLLKMMRILRVLRLVRLLRTIKPLYRLLVGVMEALMAMQWVMILTLLVLYAGAVTWTTLIGKGLLTGTTKGGERYFGTVPESLFSLFKLMNGDTSVVEPITNTVFGRLLFAGFVVLSNWSVLAILTSVVSDNMMTASARAAQEDLEVQRQADHALRAERVRGLFRDLDAEGGGTITEQEWRGLLDGRATGEELADATRLSRRALEDTCEYVEKPNDISSGRFAGYKGKIIKFEDFVRHIDALAMPADNRSLMHLTAQVRDLQEQFAQWKR